MFSLKTYTYKGLIIVLYMAISFSYHGAIGAEKPSSSIQTAIVLDQKTLIDRWKAFIPKLADCIPGTYQISGYLKPITNTPNPLYITYKISGWINDKCVVNIAFPKTEPSAYMVSECKFPKELINSTVKIFENQVLPTNDLTKMATAPIINTQVFSDCDTYFYANGIKKLLPKPGLPISGNNSNLTQKIEDYNKHFNTSVQNIDQLQADMTKRITDYSEKLRVCTPGTYQFAIAGGDNITYVTDTIVGKQGDLCITETSYQLEGLGNATIKCEFQPQTLKDVANSYPDFALINKSPLTREYSKNAINECKTTITHSR